MRYLRLFARFVEFSIGRSLQFRLDFCFRIVMDLAYYGMNIAFFKILFLHTPSLGGWNDGQMMLFVAGFCVVDGMSMCLFSNNLWAFPFLVNRGDLDYHLVRPVSALFMVSLRDFAVNSFINLLMALGILAWAISKYPGDFGVARSLWYLLLLTAGLLLHYLVRMCFLIPVFWTHSSRGFEQVYFNLSRIMERPDGVFTGWARVVVTWVLPFCLMASFPARLVIDGFSFPVLLQLLAVIALLAGVVGLLWRAGLRSYSSASS